MLKKSCFNSVIFHMTMSIISIMTFLTTVSLSLSYETAFTIFSIVISFMNLNLQRNSLFIIANVGNHSIYRLFISLSYWLTREKVLSVSGKEFIIIICDLECVIFSFNPLRNRMTQSCSLYFKTYAIASQEQIGIGR